MDYRGLITIEPGKRGGKPCIRGMRITVYDVLEYLAAGMSAHAGRQRHERSGARRRPAARQRDPANRV